MLTLVMLMLPVRTLQGLSLVLAILALLVMDFRAQVFSRIWSVITELTVIIYNRYW